MVPKIDNPHPKSEWFRRSVTYQGPKRWLELPSALKKAPSLEDFNKEIRAFYVAKFLDDGIV